ncbi:hypothetical protein SeMB42_g01579 [Synchytrium endobioticum]|uniref:Serine/threonine-protein phosphatase 2A activator n=1 Tax=Synchytrium endobioticum TaxID=286115 RepID=A0A507DL37_9FUNG|nr:hypothetical protein SeLEV6574_g01464 [Synchytrium endobioticum]TPX52236.1 hypothetical protein SeMB42_g01579 [Synchytrium endobioticum]
MSATAAEGHASFHRPLRQILTKDDLDRFHASATCRHLQDFLWRLNDSVREKSLLSETIQSVATVTLLEILDTLDSWISEIHPATETKSRFGNPSFQIWFDRLADNVENQTAQIVTIHNAVPEVATYLLHSFGDRKRIDYGTGHELSFIAFLYCLEKLGYLSPHDYPALLLNVFWRYIRVMRSLQLAYWLEPAGSHGVWGLDDYHFLPFMFGSSQLINHKYIRPKSIHDPDLVDEYSKHYMYLACIKFINSVKTVSLRWHSPMLDDISGVKTWSKVNEGMIKMYKAEVFGKLPIMQHFRFGSLIAFEGSVDAADHEHNHTHEHGEQQLNTERCSSGRCERWYATREKIAIRLRVF